MAKEHNPRPEIIHLLEEGLKPHPDTLLCVGKDTYTPQQIMEEIKKGTPFGVRFYNALEIVYNATKGVERQEPSELFARILELSGLC